MKKTVWTFGLISGLMMSVMMLLTIPFIDRIGLDRGEIIGYTTMVAAFLMVFFGIRSYRENVGGGTISFGRAFGVGMLITAFTCAFYVGTWEVIYYKMVPDFGETYAKHELEKAKAAGATPAALDAKRAELERFKAVYKNPALNVAMTLMEVLPVGLVMTLLSAAILRKKGGSRANAAVALNTT